MPVYVDELTDVVSHGAWASKQASRMYADTLEELHVVADAVGVYRLWFCPSPPNRIPCYYLSPDQRKLAVMAGARPVENHKGDARATVLFWKAKSSKSEKHNGGEDKPQQEGRTR